MAEETPTLHSLQTSLGYTFSDVSRLEEAVTHRSYLNECGDETVKDNERLEFFGDAVLDFSISHLLLDRYPSSREGELTKLRASFVDEDRLALMAQRFDLGKYLRLGKGEERSGGREKKSILADAYEAVLAAVFLDGGLDPVRRLVELHLDYLSAQCIACAGRDYKTEFQELVQSLFGITPHYCLARTSGPDHDRTFVVAAMIGTETSGEGEGRSKKEAEQAAARTALEKLRAHNGR